MRRPQRAPGDDDLANDDEGNTMNTDTDCPRVKFYLSRLSLEEIERLRQMLVHRLEHAPALATWLHSVPS